MIGRGADWTISIDGGDEGDGVGPRETPDDCCRVGKSQSEPIAARARTNAEPKAFRDRRRRTRSRCAATSSAKIRSLATRTSGESGGLAGSNSSATAHPQRVEPSAESGEGAAESDLRRLHPDPERRTDGFEGEAGAKAEVDHRAVGRVQGGKFALHLFDQFGGVVGVCRWRDGAVGLASGAGRVRPDPVDGRRDRGPSEPAVKGLKRRDDGQVIDDPKPRVMDAVDREGVVALRPRADKPKEPGKRAA